MISLPEYPSSIALVSLVALWTMTLVVKKKPKKSQTNSNLPMVPLDDIPWFGSAFSVKKMGGIVKWVKSKMNTYGPIFQAYIRGHTYIFVTDPIAARQVLNVKDTDLYSLVIGQLLTKNCVMTPQDAKVFNSSFGARHAITSKSTNNDNLTEMIVQGQQQIKQMISSQLKAGWTKSGLYELVGKMMYKVFIAQLFGIPELEASRYFEYMRIIIHDMFLFGLTDPYLQKYIHPQAFMAREALVSQIKEHLIKSDRSNETTQVSINDRHAMGGLARGLDQMSKEKGVSVDGRARSLFFMLWAGLFNVMPTVFWIVCHLLENPIAKQAILDEISHILQLRDSNSFSTANTGFTQDELNRMDKLNSVVTETLRFDTTQDMMTSHLVQRDLHMKLTLADGKKVEFDLNRGSHLITLASVANRDEEVFANADKFVWDRFVPGDDGNPVKFRKSGTVLKNPVHIFSSGPFYCPGRNFALYFLKAIVANLLLECDIRFADDVIPKSPGYRNTNSHGWTTNFAPESDIEIEFCRRGDVNGTYGDDNGF